MAKYRKIPVIQEAFQMTKERRRDNSEWPDWLHRAWNKDVDEEGAVYPSCYPNSEGTDELMIHTLAGNMLVSWDDWIVEGTQGELYPLKPDIFPNIFEAVEDDSDG